MVESDGTSESVRRVFEQYAASYPAQARIEHYRRAASERLQAAQGEAMAEDLLGHDAR